MKYYVRALGSKNSTDELIKYFKKYYRVNSLQTEVYSKDEYLSHIEFISGELIRTNDLETIEQIDIVIVFYSEDKNYFKVRLIASGDLNLEIDISLEEAIVNGWIVNGSLNHSLMNALLGV